MPDTIVSLTPGVRRFLSGMLRHAAIATTGADGSPHQAVVWYRLDEDGSILINSRVGRRWPTDLLRDPRIALTVIDDELDAEAYVSIQAMADVVATGPEALEDIRALARRYGGDPAEFDGQHRISFRLRPLAVTVHGEPGREPTEARR